MKRWLPAADPPVFGVRATRIIAYVTAKCAYPLPAEMIIDAYIEQHVGNAEWKTIAHGQKKKVARAVTVDANFPCSESNPVRRTVRTVGALRAWKFGHLPVHVLVVSRIHVSRMGAEIWKVTEGSAPYTGEGEFESGDKGAILDCVASSVADAKFIQDPDTHRLITWPKGATRATLNQWIERPHGPMHGDVVADWRPEANPAT